MIRLNRAVTRTAGRWLYLLLVFTVLALMVLPNVIVFLLSFSGDTFLKFPPGSWGLRQYTTFFGSEKWLTPLRRSLTLGTIVAAASVLVGGTAVIGFARSRLPGRNLIQVVSLGPLLVPGITYAVAVYALFARLGLLDTLTGLVLAHTVIAVPFVILIVGSAIGHVPQELELAAMSLGASRWRAYLDITVPILAPALMASAIFSFVTSFDEVVMASFLSGSAYLTLPKAIFDSIKFGVDPVITAIATILSFVTALLLVLAASLRRRVT
jgi:ABC-type spermidine/putrescine transport system permease subunit II